MRCLRPRRDERARPETVTRATGVEPVKCNRPRFLSDRGHCMAEPSRSKLPFGPIPRDGSLPRRREGIRYPLPRREDTEVGNRPGVPLERGHGTIKGCQKRPGLVSGRARPVARTGRARPEGDYATKWWHRARPGWERYSATVEARARTRPRGRGATREPGT
jgi:hypothetical protein